jgi:hypothetical protein
MEFSLTKIQEKLLNRMKANGFLTMNDFNAAYSHPFSRKACIERFLALGIMKELKDGKFEYVQEK